MSRFCRKISTTFVTCVLMICLFSTFTIRAVDINMTLTPSSKIAQSGSHYEVKVSGSFTVANGPAKELIVQKKTDFSIYGICVDSIGSYESYQTIITHSETELSFAKSNQEGLKDGNYNIYFFLLYKQGMNASADVLIDGIKVAELIWKDAEKPATTKTVIPTDKRTEPAVEVTIETETTTTQLTTTVLTTMGTSRLEIDSGDDVAAQLKQIKIITIAAFAFIIFVGIILIVIVMKKQKK